MPSIFDSIKSSRYERIVILVYLKSSIVDGGHALQVFSRVQPHLPPPHFFLIEVECCLEVATSRLTSPS